MKKAIKILIAFFFSHNFFKKNWLLINALNFSLNIWIEFLNNYKHKILSFEIWQMKIFHKYKFVLMSEWVQFFMFTFYYNRIILFFDLLVNVFISRIVSIQSWFEHKMSSTLIGRWIERFFNRIAINIQLFACSRLLILHILCVICVFFECYSSSKFFDKSSLEF